MAELNPEVVITARDEASKVLKGVGDQAAKTGKSLKDHLKDNLVPLTGAFGAVAGAAFTSIGAFAESQDTLAQLDAVLKSTGDSAKKQAAEYAKASKTIVTGTRASGNEISEWKQKLESAQAKFNDMTNSMKDNDKVSESTKLSYSRLKTEIADLQGKIASGSQTMSTTMAKSLGLIQPAARMTRDELIKLSATLQQQSKFGDEAILSAENMLLTFTSIGKDVFPDAIKTVLDMSQALGQDLKGSAVQLGKALNDPINGVTALRRVGVSFTEAQLKQIETLQTSGKIMEAQKLILNELAVEFGGSALAASKTFSGQIEILKNNLNDTQELLGEAMVNALTQFGGGLGDANQGVLAFNEFLANNRVLLQGVALSVIALGVVFGGLLLTALLFVISSFTAVAKVVAVIDIEDDISDPPPAVWVKAV